MADDVTEKVPLKGGRQRANHIQVHRIELGLWERRHIAEPLMKSAEVINLGKSVESVGKGAVYVVGAASVAATAYAVWWTLDTVYNWGEKAVNRTQEIIGQAQATVEKAGGTEDIMTNPLNPAGLLVPMPVKLFYQGWKAF